jgi:hypothetical protein
MSQKSQRVDSKIFFLGGGDIPDYWARLLAERSGVRIPLGAQIFSSSKRP